MLKFVVGVLLAVCLAFAQDTRTATLVGTVTDSTGAVVPGATVTVTNTETGFVSTGQTNAEGSYYIPYLASGSYELTIQAAGFKKYVRSGISARAADMPRIDVALEVGSVNDSVQVTAAAPLLETENASVGQVTEAKAIIQLPLLQLKPTRLLYYMAGVMPWGGAQNALGMAENQMGYMFDGVSAKETIGSVIGDTNNSVQPTMDAIEEAKLWTTGTPAEIGHTAGGALSFIFKSGTNQFHGALEDRYLNRTMVHRSYFESLPRTNPMTYHEMQATVSGPIYIPKIINGKNNTFFLFGWGRHHEKGNDPQTQTVPTADMLAGNFNFPGGQYPIYDPATIRQSGSTWISDPIPNNMVPTSRIDPAIKKFLSYTPWRTPNTGGYFDKNGPHDNLYDYTFYRSYRTRIDAKVDHQFSPNHKISGRYSQMRHRVNGRVNVAFAWPQIDTSVPSFGISQPIDQRNSVLSDYYTFSPTLMNEFRLGYNRRHATNTAATANQGWAAKLGIPNVNGATFPAFSGIYSLGALQSSSNLSEDFTFQDNVTKVMGRHTLKTGYEMIRTRQNNVSPGLPGGSYTFGGTSLPFTPNTGFSFANFMLGSVSAANFNTQLASWLPRWTSQSLYFQDDFRPMKGLTLNLGLRWSYESPFSTKWGFQSQFSPTTVDPLTGMMGAITHPRDAIYKKDLNNFQPRIGLAWNFRPQFVFRASFGVIATDMLPSAGFEEYSAQAQIQQVTGDPRPAFFLSQGPPAFNWRTNPDGTAMYLGTNYSSRGATMIDPNLRLPYTMNWSGGVQWEFAPSWLADLNYQGDAGVGLRSTVNLNQLPQAIYQSKDTAYLDKVYSATQNYRPFTQFGTITYNSNMSHSTYHSGTLRVEKRYSPMGLTVNTFYTLGKNLAGGPGDGWQYYNWDLTKGRSSYDMTHRIVSVESMELPFGKGRKWMNRGGILNQTLGGWTLTVLQTWVSGPPVTFGASGSGFKYLPGPNRPNQLVPDSKVRVANWELGPNRFPMTAQNSVFDMAAFAYPAAYTQGNLGVGTQIGNWMYWPQFSLSKHWSYKERARFTARIDANGLPTRAVTTGFNSTTFDKTNPGGFGRFTLNPSANFSTIGTPNGSLVLALRTEW